MSLEQFFVRLSAAFVLIGLGRNLGTSRWWAVAIDLVAIAFLLWADHRYEKRPAKVTRRNAVRYGHRPTAANCKFWIGDNAPVDWGTCLVCAEVKVVNRG